MTGDLVSRLLAAIQEREDVAQAASPGPWRPNAEHDEVLAVDDETVCEGFALSNRQLRATVDHVVANDPDSVLRLCQAHREIIAAYQGAVFTQECHPEYEDNNGYVAALAEVLGWLAEGYGIGSGSGLAGDQT